MSKLIRFGVSLPEDLLEKFDRLIGVKNYTNRPFASRFSCSSMLPPHLVSNPTPNQRRPAAASQSRSSPPALTLMADTLSLPCSTYNKPTQGECQFKRENNHHFGTTITPCPRRTKRPLQRNVAQPPPAVTSGPTLPASVSSVISVVNQEKEVLNHGGH